MHRRITDRRDGDLKRPEIVVLGRGIELDGSELLANRRLRRELFCELTDEGLSWALLVANFATREFPLTADRAAGFSMGEEDERVFLYYRGGGRSQRKSTP